jgi:ribosomal protein S18 acetylase RimI-like enzyme
MNMKLQKATIDDVKELAYLNHELMIAEDYDQKKPLDELIPRMKNFLQRDYEAYFVMDQGEKIGYILINISTTPLYIRQFYILPQYQRKGYGQQTIKMIQDIYDTKTFDVEVMAWNEVGLRFWKKVGFKLRCYSMRLN